LGIPWATRLSGTSSKVSAAVRDTLKANPLYGPAFEYMVDWTGHRDDLVRTNAAYK
jgi:hypothetical protein